MKPLDELEISVKILGEAEVIEILRGFAPDECEAEDLEGLWRSVRDFGRGVQAFVVLRLARQERVRKRNLALLAAQSAGQAEF